MLDARLSYAMHVQHVSGARVPEEFCCHVPVTVTHHRWSPVVCCFIFFRPSSTDDDVKINRRLHVKMCVRFKKQTCCCLAYQTILRIPLVAAFPPIVLELCRSCSDQLANVRCLASRVHHASHKKQFAEILIRRTPSFVTHISPRRLIVSFQDGFPPNLWFAEDGNTAAEMGHLVLMKHLKGVKFALHLNHEL